MTLAVAAAAAVVVVLMAVVVVATVAAAAAANPGVVVILVLVVVVQNRLSQLNFCFVRGACEQLVLQEITRNLRGTFLLSRASASAFAFLGFRFCL